MCKIPSQNRHETVSNVIAPYFKITNKEEYELIATPLETCYGVGIEFQNGSVGCVHFDIQLKPEIGVKDIKKGIKGNGKINNMYVFGTPKMKANARIFIESILTTFGGVNIFLKEHTSTMGGGKLSIYRKNGDIMLQAHANECFEKDKFDKIN